MLGWFETSLVSSQGHFYSPYVAADPHKFFLECMIGVYQLTLNHSTFDTTISAICLNLLSVELRTLETHHSQSTNILRKQKWISGSA